MTSKFTECTLGLMFRKVNPDGTISGGGMYYLEKGLAEVSPALKIPGKILAVIFAIMVMGAALGGGNMFQSNQAYEAIDYVFKIDSKYGSAVFGVIMAIFVGMIILGGIKRIGAATSKIVPLMAGIYVLACLAVIFMNIGGVPAAIGKIIKGAFTPEAGIGGLIGVLVVGVQRASFSSEAGLGSAAIAHSAAKTKEPVREGFVALLEPFIDTVVICNMTAMVIILSGVYTTDVDYGTVNRGVAMTKDAFAQSLAFFPHVLVVCVVLFAYSTMISWCYYGERGWIYLLDHLGEGTGLKSLMIFRIVFVAFVYIGAVTKLSAVLDFSDYLLLSLAFPNIIGCIIMLPMLKRKVDDYWNRLKSGEMKTFK